MTFNMRPVTQGYGNIASRQFGTELNKVPRWKHETHTRFAGDALEQITRNKILEKQLEGLWKRQGLDAQQGTDWPGLGMKVVSLAGGLGAFGGGGGGDSFAGVDNSVLDSVLGDAGTYSSGMTSLY